MTTHSSIHGSSHYPKEHNEVKENASKIKSGASKKGMDGGSGGTKIESTGSSTKKLIFSFKKDSKGLAKMPIGTSAKSNVFV